jgi:hypothetical protein
MILAVVDHADDLEEVSCHMTPEFGGCEAG